MKATARFLLIAFSSFFVFTVLFAATEITQTKPRFSSFDGFDCGVPAPELATKGNNLPIAGQDPEPDNGIVLVAPDLCEVGELVRFDATESTVNLTWQILPHTDDFEVIESGKRAFFSSRVPGSYLVIVAGAKGDMPFLQHFTIVVEGTEPAPGPDTLPAKIARWVRKVEKYEGKNTDAARLAANFRKLATSEELEVDQILNATAVGNSAALGDNLEKWIPFLEELGTELDAYVDAGELDTREDYRDTWLAIVAGIERTIPKEAKTDKEEPVKTE